MGAGWPREAGGRTTDPPPSSDVQAPLVAAAVIADAPADVSSILCRTWGGLPPSVTTTLGASAPATPGEGVIPLLRARVSALLAGLPARRAAAPPDGCAGAVLWRQPVLISVIVLGILASLDPLRPVVFVLVLRTQLGERHRLPRRVDAGTVGAVRHRLRHVRRRHLGSPDHRTGGGVGRGDPGSGRRCSSSRRAGGVAATTRGSGGYPRAVLRRLDHLDVRRAAVIGVLIQPRTLTVAAAVVIARDQSGLLSLVVGFALFAIVSTAALVGILTYDLWRPESARVRLTDVVSTLERQGPMIFTVLCAAGGGYLVLDGLRDLVL